LTKPGEPYYEMLRDWIAQGTQFDLESSSRVTSIEIEPKNPIVPRAGMTQQMTVIANYSDGSRRDVTKEAFVESGNIEVISAAPGGMLTMLRRGEAPVLVRYEGSYAATTLIVMNDRTGFAWTNPPKYNFIDELIYEKLERVKIVPADLCSDDEFVRRVYLDITGLPPSPAAVKDFLADPTDSKIKREKLVDSLVGNPDYVEYWTNKWADLLQVNRKFLGEEGSIALRNWIQQSVAENKPYDQFAREIIESSGSTLEHPEAAYYKVLREPADVMENTTHLFLAVRFNCNKCHDHPFERWTQDQYYQLAAYFAQVGRKEDPRFAGKFLEGTAVEGGKPLVEVIYDAPGGEIKHDRTGLVTAPAFPYQHEDVAADATSRRSALAKWITSPKNQYFARSFVNRQWGYLFGVGIIEPIDDIRAGNPPSNPALLDALEQEFIKSGFDTQHMLRVICKSRVYQHSINTNRWNEDDDVNFSHAVPRRLPAEVLFDAIHFCAGSKPNIPGLPVGFRATQLPDAGIKIPFLDDLGKPVRESACECERSSQMVLGPIMKLVNGPTVADALSDSNNELVRLVKDVSDDRELIREVFLRFLSRMPTDREIELAREAIADAGSDYEQNVQELKVFEESLGDQFVAWESNLKRTVNWTPLEVDELASAVGATFAKEADHVVFVNGTLAIDNYTFTANTDLATLTGIKLELLADSRLPQGGPGRAQNGNVVVSELKLKVAPAETPDQFVEVPLEDAVADFSQEGWNVSGAIDNNPGSGWAVSPAFNQNHFASFEIKQPVTMPKGARLKFEIVQNYPDGTHLIGKFRVSVSDSPQPFTGTALTEPLASLIKIPVADRTAEQTAEIRQIFFQSNEEYQRLKRTVAQSESERANPRLAGMQDLCWALINNPSFLFNR
jgi:Protein of unknown function (DUF1553)/Protein of unknown function (DUF1549)